MLLRQQRHQFSEALARSFILSLSVLVSGYDSVYVDRVIRRNKNGQRTLKNVQPASNVMRTVMMIVAMRPPSC
ncbi:unnamed protein product [Pieris brassicae]|uniref:Uncharacterized protein n=1 Tax=Pieris brassicae TaxID=7116 RepID=A0A9P0X6Y3_PIEBR|nr:unnamed protein product [Pieris brassicae]